MTTTATIEEVILQTDATGAPVRLEYVRGRLKAEASPTVRHQKAAGRIERSIRPILGDAGGCGCFVLADTLIRFPDPAGTLKRPDIAVFCTEPPDIDEALEQLPDAVIEILSLGYEEKDLGDDGAPFYLACGVADVLVVDHAAAGCCTTGPAGHPPSFTRLPQSRWPVDAACRSEHTTTPPILNT